MGAGVAEQNHQLDSLHDEHAKGWNPPERSCFSLPLDWLTALGSQPVKFDDGH